MLFNSYNFLFYFLPSALVLFHVLRRSSWDAALVAVSALSLVFYASWDPRYLALLIPSLVVNYWLGELIARTRQRVWLWVGVALNLAVIGWFVPAVLLRQPDGWRGGAGLPSRHHAAAGHFVHHLSENRLSGRYLARLSEGWLVQALCLLRPVLSATDRRADCLVPQPGSAGRPRPALRRRGIARSMCLGVMLFAIGLFKKVMFADSLGYFADAAFAAGRAAGLRPGPRDAWLGALTYSLQLYFDFSAYSDMAIGLAWMFGFRLPMNFNSPYQAATIIDFWRRWHMTLSRVLSRIRLHPARGQSARRWRGRRCRRGRVPARRACGTGPDGRSSSGAVFTALLVLINHLWCRKVPVRIPWPIARTLTMIACRQLMGRLSLAVVAGRREGAHRDDLRRPGHR